MQVDNGVLLINLPDRPTEAGDRGLSDGRINQAHRRQRQNLILLSQLRVKLPFITLKRKSALDDNVRVEAKLAFRELRLQIDQLRDVYRRHRPQQYRNMPPLDPAVVRSLLDETKRLRAQITLWLSVVEGHRPVRLIYVCQKLDRALKVLEDDLEWERQLATILK
jgi:hypothetical protein